MTTRQTVEMADVTIDDAPGAVDDVDGTDQVGERALESDELGPDGLEERPVEVPAERRTIGDRVRSITLPQVLLLLVMVIYTWYYTQRSLNIHHALGTSSYDSALYDQGVWLLSRFDAPFVTLMGRNMFGDHTSFVLLFLVPIYWLWPSAGVLFFSQSAVIAAGAMPVFLLARKRLSGEWIALALASAYLIHPAIGWTNLENFHPDSFVGVFLGFAIWAALEHKWRTYAVFVVLALSVKEDVSLVVVPLGIWVGFKRSWKIGALTIFGSLATMAVAMFVVMRGLIGVPTRNGWRIPFGGPRGVIDTALTNPTDLVRHLRSDDRPWYLVQMTAPFAFVFARLPWVAMVSALVLFTNILSTFWYQYQIQYHYSLIAVPALSLGTVHALSVMRQRRTMYVTPLTQEFSVSIPLRSLCTAAVLTMSLLASYLWAPVPWGRIDLYYGDPNNQWAVAARDIIEDVPPDAIVSAHYRITPHIAHRHEIYQFPAPFRAVLYGPDGNVDGPRVVDRAERIEIVILSVDTNDYPFADWQLISPAFRLVDENEFWLKYERDFDVELPPEMGS